MKNKIAFICLILVLCFSVFSYGEENWKEYRTHHFKVYYKNVPMDFVESVEEMAEYYYHEISKNLGFMRYEGWTWDKRATIYIYKDVDDYIESSSRPSWSSGTAAVRKKIIRTFPAAHGFFDSTLPHELGHIIFREFVGFSSDIPLWLDEGVAMYQEKARRWGANKTVLTAIESDAFIPLYKLEEIQFSQNTDRKLINLFYSESASVVYYLISEFGRHKFVNFCHKLKDGQSLNKALYNTYIRFKDSKELNDTWVAYLKRTQRTQ